MKNLGRLLIAVLLSVLLVPALPALAGTVPEDVVPETTAATQPRETEPETMFSAPYNLYFGLLHGHTDLSDGLGTVDEAFFQAAGAELDFFAVTDHSNSLTEEEWAAGKTVAKDSSTEDFLGLFGYEMTWQETKRIGHIVTFGTQSFLSRDQAEFSDPYTGLENYYRALKNLPGAAAMLCHPGEYFGDFHSFGHYNWEYDRSIALLEVVSGGDGIFYDRYTQALDAGWHLAPSANQNNHNGNWGTESAVRTVVLADDLTEESLLSAIRARRVYATEDGDLHLSFDLDGCDMGGILPQALEPEITVLAWDPTDAAIGTVEVVTEGGQVLASEQTTENDVYLTIPVSGGFRYYYLRITQPDGDVAVTAPVWVEPFDRLGILEFSAENQNPVQEEPVTLTLTLYNEETADFRLDAVTLYADGQQVQVWQNPGTVVSGGTLELTLSYTHPVSGETELEALVRGTVCGQSRSDRATLRLRFRSGVEVTGILVDGSHGNAGLEDLDRFCVIAEEEKLDVTLVEGDLPQGGSLLLIPDPQTAFDGHFMEDVQTFAQSGGDLILWGRKEILDPLIQQLNLTMKLGTDELEAGASEIFNKESPWCGQLVGGQYFAYPAFTSVEVGQGQWLVRRSADGPVLLGCEKTAWGGTVFLSGGPLLLDEQLPEQKSVWDLPRANETLLRTILGRKQEILAQRSVQSVRGGTKGESYRIKGYVTAGTSNPHNRFPDTLYLQDETGGIAVTGFSTEGIQVGAPLEIIGILAEDGGNTVLEYEDHRLLQENYYRWVPETAACGKVSDYKTLGGSLVRVEGRVTALTLTADRKGITRLEVTDFRGETAIIEIEEYIFSGASGENRLAEEIRKGRTVRAMGLVHINAAGETVIRVRNCDEVVYVPPTTDVSNPDTGDRFFRFRR